MPHPFSSLCACRGPSAVAFLLRGSGPSSVLPAPSFPFPPCPAARLRIRRGFCRGARRLALTVWGCADLLALLCSEVHLLLERGSPQLYLLAFQLLSLVLPDPDPGSPKSHGPSPGYPGLSPPSATSGCAVPRDTCACPVSRTQCQPPSVWPRILGHPGGNGSCAVRSGTGATRPRVQAVSLQAQLFLRGLGASRPRRQTDPLDAWLPIPEGVLLCPHIPGFLCCEMGKPCLSS